MTDTLTAPGRPILSIAESSTSDRWQPTRAGLVSIWRYWDETFTFHRGRLLLRGPNGAGKSMALELLLPFLLDGDTSPWRLTSAAKSRGGLFERVMTGTSDASRTGYAWVEFGRGNERFTVGARLRASTATRKVDVDFFTTSLAVGDELQLLDDQRVPLSRKSLVEAIGETGRVHGTADEHRTAVRTTLFSGFSADRYDSVITALLALRKEKLSQNLDIAKLSQVLSEALPPLDDHDLAAVAEGFERLDRRRADIDRLQADTAEVAALVARQRDYSRAVLSAVAGDVRGAESRRDGVTRAERQARDSLSDAQEAAETAAARVAELDQRMEAIDTEVEALKSHDAYREGVKLDDLRGEARRLAEYVARADDTARDREVDSREAEAELQSATDTVATCRANADVAADGLALAGAAVGAAAVIDEATSDGAEGDVDDAVNLVHAWTGTRRQRVAEVRSALGAHRTATQHRDFQQTRVDSDATTADERSRTAAAAAETWRNAVDEYGAAVRHWVDTSSAIRRDRLALAVPSPVGDPDLVQARLAALRSELHAEFAVSRRDAGAARSALVGERESLEEERAALAEGRLVEPDAPSWRDDRFGRSGAPLWRLVDVASGIESAVVDGIEAALVGAGLLDAWVEPDGTIDLPGMAGGPADVTLGTGPAQGTTLADMLVPLDGTPVPPAVVESVLSSVAVRPASDDATPVAVGTDGTFRLGAARGRGPRKPAGLLGAAAQERRRLARIAELQAQVVDVETKLGELDRVLAAIDRQQQAADAEIDAAPSGQAVADSVAAVAAAEYRLSEAEDRLAAARRELAAAEQVVRERLRDLTTRGAQCELPTDEAALAEVEAALRRVEQAADTWGRRRRELRSAETAVSTATDRAARATSAASAAREDATTKRRDADAAAVRIATLESTIGAEYRTVLDRIAASNDEKRTSREELRHLAAQRPEIDKRVGQLEADLCRAEADRAAAEEQRDAAHRRFVAAVGSGLAGDAGVTIASDLETITSVLEASRAVAGDLERTSADATSIEKASSRVDERLHVTRAALGGRADIDREWSDAHGWWVLSASLSGVRRSAVTLAEAMEQEFRASREELQADEEQLFEQVLAGSVRRALAGRIRHAAELVKGINEQLAAVRTLAGDVAVRLAWEVDPDQLDAVKSARALLLRDPADLSDEETAALQAFVRARVDQARAELEANAPWEARLRESLDYRAWHRFSMQIAHRDWDGFQPATAARLQRLSTGERSIALHLPMIASIATHYADESGQPAGCPRLILLDELFAGVDPANRSQLFGTFASWGLDAVLTSDHEWCQYATLDGIAIHHLHPPSGDEPVTSTRFTWDGRRRFLDQAS